VVSIGCAERHCSAGHALVGITIATMMSLRHRRMTDSHDTCALAEVCTVPVLLVDDVSVVSFHVFTVCFLPPLLLAWYCFDCLSVCEQDNSGFE